MGQHVEKRIGESILALSHAGLALGYWDSCGEAHRVSA
jgi:hypothetical protein